MSPQERAAVRFVRRQATLYPILLGLLMVIGWGVLPVVVR